MAKRRDPIKGEIAARAADHFRQGKEIHGVESYRLFGEEYTSFQLSVVDRTTGYRRYYEVTVKERI